MLLTYPLMVGIQEISARIGRVTGHGIAGNVRRNFPAPAVWFLTVLLFTANTINVAADLGAMADSLKLLIGGPSILYVILFGTISVLAQLVFALGIIGTGLLAVPVLAGSTAYAIGEWRKWPVGLSRKPKQAMAFYGVLAVSGGFGIALNFTALDPIKALYWSAVINGVLAAPVMVMLMLLARSRKVMGDLTVRGWLYGLGWASTAVMSLCSVAMAFNLAM